ncbi:MAG TPA: hypothetical protein VMT03_23880 [Polyangia bacterium]|nr:hypothetical protein [Polyangia bacterium]
MSTAFLPCYVLLAELTNPAVTSPQAIVSETRALDALPGTLVFDATLRSEFRAGEAPALSNLPTQSFAAALITPRVDLGVGRPGMVWTAWYSPRLFWQVPHLPAATDLLVLHTFGLALDVRLSRRTQVTASVGGSVGALDYTALPQVLGTIQAALPPVLQVSATTAQGVLSIQLSSRWTFGLGGTAFYWRWLEVPAGLPPDTVTQQVALSGGPGLGFRASHVDTFRVDVPIQEAWYSNDSHFLVVTPATTWRRALARRVDLSLRLGLSYAQSTLTSGASIDSPGEVAIGPVGSVELVSRVARWDEATFSARASAGVDHFLDPVIGVGVRQWFAAGQLDAVSSRRGALGLRGAFATVFGEVPTAPGVGQPDETVFSLGVWMRKRMSAYVLAECGGLWADRAPPLATPDFHFHQRQLWIYLTLAATTKPATRSIGGSN